jgi:hypothetical protein
VSKNKRPIIVDSDESFDERWERECKQLHEEFQVSIARIDLEIQMSSDRIDESLQDTIDGLNGSWPAYGIDPMPSLNLLRKE